MKKMDIDMKLSTIEPKHLETLTRIFDFFKSENGKRIIQAGFRHTKIQETVANARNGIVTSLDPFI